MKKSILVAILVAVMLLAAVGSVNAASVKPSKTTIKAGETVTVTVAPSEARDGVQFDVTYDATKLSYEGTAKPAGMELMDEVSNGTGRVMVYSMNGTTTSSVVMTFKALTDIDATDITITGFVSGEEKLDTAGKATLKIEKADETKDPDDDNKNTETKDPVDVNGKPIKNHPQTGTPIYVAAVALIVVAAGVVLAIRKNK